jgi:hypothetical protein
LPARQPARKEFIAELKAKYDSAGDFAEAGDRPCVIGEFKRGLAEASSEAERASSFFEYLRSVAADPRFVGAHRFQYIDSPSPAESSATDTPYPKMVAAARGELTSIYERRHFSK